MKKSNIKKIQEWTEQDIAPTESFEIQDSLNPDVFDNMKMNHDVKEKLLEIANEFLNNLYKAESLDVYDIVLTGSLSSYNWSQYSDFDIHIQIDYSDINDDEELVAKYLELLGKRFNRDYEINIRDYEVEVYIENKGEERSHVNGIYSILKDKWVRRPSPNDVQDVDKKLIEKKAINIMEHIEELETRIEGGEYDDLKEDTKRIWSKIKKARRDGINSPDGEFSIGNLVFKYLRRNEYIGRIIDVKKKIVEKKYSLYSGK